MWWWRSHHWSTLRRTHHHLLIHILWLNHRVINDWRSHDLRHHIHYSTCPTWSNLSSVHEDRMSSYLLLLLKNSISNFFYRLRWWSLSTKCNYRISPKYDQTQTTLEFFFFDNIFLNLFFLIIAFFLFIFCLVISIKMIVHFLNILLLFFDFHSSKFLSINKN